MQVNRNQIKVPLNLTLIESKPSGEGAVSKKQENSAVDEEPKSIVVN